MRIILVFIFSALALATASFAAFGCGSDQDGASGPTVVATTTHVADLTRNVAGDDAEVHGVMAPNADPHDYEPRPSDAEALAEAELVIESGGDLDQWADQLVESSGTDATVVELIEGVPTISGEHEHAEESGSAEGEDEQAEDGEVDPHWWHDPRNVVVAVERIRDALAEVDPEHAADYEANAADYVDRIERLDAEVARCIERLPASERKLVTSHDSLGYLADRYRLEVVGAAIPALTTQAQPSAADTAELVDLIEDEGVSAVFSEAGVSAALEEAVAGETGAEVGAELWADALGGPGSSGETYLDAHAANAATLVEGLSRGRESCDAGAS